jgi:hypothetical protein
MAWDGMSGRWWVGNGLGREEIKYINAYGRVWE